MRRVLFYIVIAAVIFLAAKYAMTAFNEWTTSMFDSILTTR
jgi:hypothetical protein